MDMHNGSTVQRCFDGDCDARPASGVVFPVKPAPPPLALRPAPAALAAFEAGVPCRGR